MTDEHDDVGQRFSRRGFLAAGAAALAASQLLATPAAPHTHAKPAQQAAGAGGFRFVHLTDIHVQRDRRGAEGLQKCLEAVHALKPRPDFIFTGGDQVMDSLNTPFDRVCKLFDLYTGIMRDSDIPVYDCLGNHDVFGWGPKYPAKPTDPSYGKKLWMDRVGKGRTNYSFDHKGWHLCALDGIQYNKETGYDAYVSEETLDWLDRDLAAAGAKPKVIVTHIPIITVTGFYGLQARDLNIRVFGANMCRNAGPVLSLLRKHAVQLVLSGHEHENETIRYEDTTHLEDAAVCGAWWRGAHRGNPEGFGVIDVHPDGTFEHRYETFGWVADMSA